MLRHSFLALVFVAGTNLSAWAFSDTQCDDNEGKCLAILGPSAKRSGDRLSFRLGNGQRVSLKDNQAIDCEEPCYDYALTGIHSGFVIIRKLYQIGGEGILIRLQDEFRINLIGAAVI